MEETIAELIVVVHASSVFDSVKAQWPSTKMFNWCGEFVTKYE